MSRIKAVLFDFDGTLIDRVAAFRRMAEALYDDEPAIQAAVPRAEFVDLMVVWDEDGYAAREDLYARVLKSWPGVSRSLQELLAFHSRMLPASVLPDERVVAFLRKLSTASVPWGVITNGGSGQRPKIASAGFDDIMPFAIVSYEVGYEKPDPRIYQDGLKLLGGVTAASTLFVGDNPETDIGGAQTAGMPTAWVRRGGTWPVGSQPPDYQIDHVDELRAVLL